jgi:hypothetical protein
MCHHRNVRKPSTQSYFSYVKRRGFVFSDWNLTILIGKKSTGTGVALETGMPGTDWK